MRRIFVVLVCLGLIGCATIQEATSPNRTNILKVSIGMTKSEVINIMGSAPTTAWGSDNFGIRQSLTINNPYRSEILQGKEKVFEVIYYVTDVKKDDNAITDDELTPLIFDNGKLIGWGWGFLEDNAQKYEIRMR